jgi:tetratricopeptide (TPR) repeat protein
VRNRSITMPAASASILAFCVLAFALNLHAQQEQSNAEARSLLREASVLIPQIVKTQQPSALANIAVSQIVAGDFVGALATYRANAKRGDNGMAVNSVAGLLASHGHLPLALDLVSRADPKFQPNAYSLISTQLAMEKHFDDALAAAHMIRGTAYDLANALMWINNEQLKAGDLQGAHNTLNEVLDAISRTQELALASADPNLRNLIPEMYQNVVRRLVYAGDRDDALAAVERFYAFVNTVDDPWQKERDQSALASTQAIVGQFEAALDTAQQLPPNYLRDTAMETIAEEKSLHGDTAAALQDASLVEGDFLRNTSLRAVADGLASSGDYRQALAVIDLIQAPGERANGLSELALQQAEANDPKAPLTVQLASEAAYNAGEETPTHVFEQIAVARGILKDFAGAEELIGRLKDEDRVWPLWTLTEYLVNAGRTAEAISLAESQSGALPKAYALLGTATSLTVPIPADGP